MEEREGGNSNHLQYVLLLLLPMMETVIYGLIRKAETAESVRSFLWAVLFSAIFLLYLLLKRGQTAGYPKRQMQNSWLLIPCQLLSVPLALCYEICWEIPLYVLGAVIVAALVDMETGMVMSVYLTFFVLLTSSEIKIVIVLLPFGLMLCLLSHWLAKKGSFCFVLITGEAAAMMLCVLSGVGDFKEEPQQLFWFMFSTAGILLFVLFAKLFFLHTTDTEMEQLLKDVKQEGQIAEFLTEELAAGREEEIVSPQIAEEVCQITPEQISFCMEHELLKRLQKEQPKVYVHSKKIANYSRRAADLIGADAVLCELGGLYHEIGKLEDKKEYIMTGQRMMKEAGMPEELTTLVMQMYCRQELPANRESAIVMLTDNIVSTLLYLKQKNEKILTSKVVENIFKLRLIKGTLDQSQLSINDYSRLKRYYLMEFVFESEQTEV